MGSTEDLAGARHRAEQLLAAGEALLAYEAIEQCLALWPGDLRLRQLRGLALARSGAAERANRAMRELIAEGHQDGETLGILARTHKDLAARATERVERARHLEEAFLAYQRGYEAAIRLRNDEGAYFTGINAASLSLLLGETRRARELAGAVRARCREQLDRSGAPASYWLLATLAEAALVLGERAEAAEHYRRAAESAGPRHADLCSTRRQARLLLAQRGEPASWLDDILRIPPVVVCSGHLVDHPERTRPRFPPELEHAVSHALREKVRRLGPAAGYASAACGADILFLEAMLAEGREFHVVLPFPPAEFRATSVEITPGGDWGARFDRLLAAAASVTTASDDYAAGSESTFVYANLVLTGMAALHARRLETECLGLAVWDGTEGESGGTGALVRHWESLGVSLERIDPASLSEVERLGAGARGTVEPPRSGPAAVDPTAHPMLSMLFADAVGYSKLGENQIPLFVQHFLTPIAELIARSPRPPLFKETAGDGFYFVFRHGRDAGLFALELQDLLSRIDWEARGLPPMGLRVALHCGPVHEITDPITGQQKYTGPHTSRAARIEPITPPGQVYASQAFAAIVAASRADDLVFEYVGRTSLAKDYGSLPLYHVRRA